MKPVVERIIDKNGGTFTRFNPTGKMIYYAVTLAQNPTLTEKEVLSLCRLPKITLDRWKEKYGSEFSYWLEEMVDQCGYDEKAAAIEAVGMVEALQGNYNFWKDMAKKNGVIEGDSKLTININTDFSQVLVAGESFEERRKQLLSQIRGVGESGKPRLAGASTPEHAGSSKSAGARAGEVQERSVVLADPLGSNRR